MNNFYFYFFFFVCLIYLSTIARLPSIAVYRKLNFTNLIVDIYMPLKA